MTATDRRRIPEAGDVSAIRRTLDDLGIEYGGHDGGRRLRFLCPYCEQRPVRKGNAKDYSAGMEIQTTQWACWSMACTSLLRRRGYFQWDGDDLWRRCGNLVTSSSSGGARRGRKPHVVGKRQSASRSSARSFFSGDAQALASGNRIRNSGAEDGTIDLAPIRQYDDGQTNESAMDMSSGNKVPAHSTVKLHTDPFTYKAHQHEVVGCSVRAGDTEIPLRVVHLND